MRAKTLGGVACVMLVLVLGAVAPAPPKADYASPLAIFDAIPAEMMPGKKDTEWNTILRQRATKWLNETVVGKTVALTAKYLGNGGVDQEAGVISIEVADTEARSKSRKWLLEVHVAADAPAQAANTVSKLRRDQRINLRGTVSEVRLDGEPGPDSSFFMQLSLKDCDIK